MSTANLGKLRLCKLLGQLTRDSDAEVLTAARHVVQQLKTTGLTWFQFAGIDERGNDLLFNPTNSARTNEAPKEDIWARAARARQEKADAEARRKAWAHDPNAKSPGDAARSPNGKPYSKTRFDTPYRWDGFKAPVTAMITFCESELAWNLSTDGKVSDRAFLETVRNWNGSLTPAQFKFLGRLHQWCREQLAAQRRSA